MCPCYKEFSILLPNSVANCICNLTFLRTLKCYGDVLPSKKLIALFNAFYGRSILSDINVLA
uniref:Putative ovule protein n=1 Tax=Solanum chacoense TaxID=4108 RepID=A0A0V0GZ96_SOLCH